MPSAFQCSAFLKKRNVILNLFQHLIPLFLFLGLAYAELKVNFVEGFAVLCASHVSMASPFLASLFLASLFLASLFLASLFLWLRRFSLRCFSLRCFYGFAVSGFLCASHVSMASPFKCLRRLILTLFLLLCRGVPRHNNIETLCVAFLFKKSSIVSSI